jgi:hypothetical protein
MWESLKLSEKLEVCDYPCREWLHNVGIPKRLFKTIIDPEIANAANSWLHMLNLVGV